MTYTTNYWIMKMVATSSALCENDWLITGVNSMPASKSTVNQLSIFDNQVLKFVSTESKVAKLNSFPIFIYEYMK